MKKIKIAVSVIELYRFGVFTENIFKQKTYVMFNTSKGWEKNSRTPLVCNEYFADIRCCQLFLTAGYVRHHFVAINQATTYSSDWQHLAFRLLSFNAFHCWMNPTVVTSGYFQTGQFFLFCEFFMRRGSICYVRKGCIPFPFTSGFDDRVRWKTFLPDYTESLYDNDNEKGCTLTMGMFITWSWRMELNQFEFVSGLGSRFMVVWVLMY